MARTHHPLSRRALVLGIAGGMRSLTPMAVIALTPGASPPWPLLQRRWGKAALVALAVAELVGDKLPTTPSRLSPPALLGRIGAAALAGAALGAGDGAGRGCRSRGWHRRRRSAAGRGRGLLGPPPRGRGHRYARPGGRTARGRGGDRAEPGGRDALIRAAASC